MSDHLNTVPSRKGLPEEAGSNGFRNVAGLSRRERGEPRSFAVHPWVILGWALMCFAWMSGLPVHATVLHVDQADPLCSDVGPGTLAAPFCTISAGARIAVAGDTVLVKSGIYREQVVPQYSGTQEAPITFKAAPGAVAVITGQTNGFRISSKSWIVVNGFTIRYTASVGIYVRYSSHITISRNRVIRAGRPVTDQDAEGIYLYNTTDSLVFKNVTNYNSNSGICVAYNSARNRIVGNVSSHNAMVYARKAAGISIKNQSGNLIKNNICYNNEDSGIQIITNSKSNLIVNNLSYGNGDHGIHLFGSVRQRVIGNTVYGNVTSGINVESASTGCSLANNISVDNAINSPRTDGNIRVDEESISGAVLDYNLLFMSQPAFMVQWGSVKYPSLAEFVAATGMEAHGIEADPLWIAPESGNFRLLAGSPAIDSANSGANGALPTDKLSLPRVDDPATPDTGVGPRTYDDRGAFEYQPPAAAGSDTLAALLDD